MSKLKSLDTLERIIRYNDLRNPVKGQTELVDLIEKDLNILQIFKEAIEIERVLPPEIEMTKNNTFIFQEAIRVHEKRIEETVKQALRKWVLENACPTEIRAFEIIKELFDFDFALRFPNNQPMLRITNKRTNEYWEIPISKGEYELLKEVIK